MAWVFSLSAECGIKQSEAQQFAQYFNEISWVLSNGRHSQCRAESFQDIEENWWCRVCPSGISEIGIDTPESAYLMTEIGILSVSEFAVCSTVSVCFSWYGSR
jgi:hypothetical protein